MPKGEPKGFHLALPLGSIGVMCVCVFLGYQLGILLTQQNFLFFWGESEY